MRKGFLVAFFLFAFGAVVVLSFQLYKAKCEVIDLERQVWNMESELRICNAHRGSKGSTMKTRPVVLLTADGGEEVARLDPDTLRENDGSLPTFIKWNDRHFERGWTNEGNTDADERLWFEVKP